MNQKLNHIDTDSEKRHTLQRKLHILVYWNNKCVRTAENAYVRPQWYKSQNN